MKVLCIVLFAYLSCFSLQRITNDSIDDFAKLFFNHCIDNNLNGLLFLKVNEEDIKTTILKSSLNEDKKNELLKKFSKDKDEITSNINRGLSRFDETVKQSKCTKKEIRFIKVIDKIHDFKGIMLGTVEIIYICKNLEHKIIVEIIKTEKGWKIMDDVFVD